MSKALVTRVLHIIVFGQVTVMTLVLLHIEAPGIPLIGLSVQLCLI
jgi:hypothetical protein